MKSILELMLEEYIEDKRRAKRRFVRTTTILLVVVALPLCISLLVSMFRMYVFDPSNFTIQNITYDASIDPDHIYCTAGYNNTSPVSIQFDGTELDFYACIMGEHCLFLSLKNDKIAIKMGETMMVTVKLAINKIVNNRLFEVIRAKKFRIVYKHHVSIKIGWIFGMQRDGEIVINMNEGGGGCMEIANVLPANDGIKLDVMLVGYELPVFLNVLTNTLRLNVDYCGYNCDVEVESISIRDGRVQKRVCVWLYLDESFCLNSVVCKILDKGDRSWATVKVLSLRNRMGKFNELFDGLVVPVTVNRATAKNEQALTTFIEYRDMALFIHTRNSVLSAIFRYIDGVSFNVWIDKKEIPNVNFDKITENVYRLSHVDKLLEAVVCGSKIAVRPCFQSRALEMMCKRMYVKYSRKHGLRCSFMKMNKNDVNMPTIDIFHKIKSVDKNTVIIDTGSFTCIDKKNVGHVYNIVCENVSKTIKGLNIRLSAEIYMFYDRNGTFINMSLKSTLIIGIKEEYCQIKNRKELFSGIFADTGKVDVPWYYQLVDNTHFKILKVADRIEGIITASKFVSRCRYNIKNRIVCDEEIVLTLCNEGGEPAANIYVNANYACLLYSLEYGPCIKGLNVSIELDISCVHTITEHVCISCTSQSALSTLLRPLVADEICSSKQKNEQVNESDSSCFVHLSLTTNEELRLRCSLYYCDQDPRTTYGMRISWPQLRVNAKSASDKRTVFFRMVTRSGSIMLKSLTHRNSASTYMYKYFVLRIRYFDSDLSETQCTDEQDLITNSFYLKKYFIKNDQFSLPSFIKFCSAGSSGRTCEIEIVLEDNPFAGDIIIRNKSIKHKIGQLLSFFRVLNYNTLPSKCNISVAVNQFNLLYVKKDKKSILNLCVNVKGTICLPIVYNECNKAKDDDAISLKISYDLKELDKSMYIDDLFSLKVSSDMYYFIKKDDEHSDMLYNLDGTTLYIFFGMEINIRISTKNELVAYVLLDHNVVYELRLCRFLYKNSLFIPICSSSDRHIITYLHNFAPKDVSDMNVMTVILCYGNTIINDLGLSATGLKRSKMKMVYFIMRSDIIRNWLANYVVNKKNDISSCYSDEDIKELLGHYMVIKKNNEKGE